MEITESEMSRPNTYTSWQKSQDQLLAEILGQQGVMQTLAANPLAQQALTDQLAELHREYVRDAARFSGFGDDLEPEPPCTVVDEAGNPMPWSEE